MGEAGARGEMEKVELASEARDGVRMPEASEKPGEIIIPRSHDDRRWILMVRGVCKGEGVE